MERYLLTTKFGPVSLQLNSATAVYLSGILRVNGVELNVWCHLGLYDGEWQLWREKGSLSGSYHMLLLRKSGGEEGSGKAREKVLPELCRVVGEWVESNPGAVADRVRQRKLEEIESLGHKLDLVLVEADTIRARIDELRAQV